MLGPNAARLFGTAGLEQQSVQTPGQKTAAQQEENCMSVRPVQMPL